MKKHTLHVGCRVFSVVRAGLREKTVFGKALALSGCLHLTVVVAFFHQAKYIQTPKPQATVIEIEIRTMEPDKCNWYIPHQGKATVTGRRSVSPVARVSREENQPLTRNPLRTVAPFTSQPAAQTAKSKSDVTNPPAFSASSAIPVQATANQGSGVGTAGSDPHGRKEDNGRTGTGKIEPVLSGAGYRKILRSLIDSHKEYPLAARRIGIKGSVTISFTLDGHGELKRVSLSKSSGYSILDNAGVKAVRDVGRFPPPPCRDLIGDEISFSIPITFALTSS